jgi:hypothetical protein
MYAIWRVCVFSVSLHCGEEKRQAKGGNDFLLFGRFHRFRPRELHRQPSAPTSDDKTPAKPQEKWGGGGNKNQIHRDNPHKMPPIHSIIIFYQTNISKGLRRFQIENERIVQSSGF